VLRLKFESDEKVGLYKAKGQTNTHIYTHTNMLWPIKCLKGTA